MNDDFNTPEMEVKMPILTVTQPIGRFYLGVLNAPILYKCSFADVRRLVDNDLDEFMGIQRHVSEARLTELRKYIHNVDATFPTGIILSTTSSQVELNGNVLTFKMRGDVFKILDGQHRIVAFRDVATEESFQFELPVVVFVDMDLQDQAQTFAVINLSQTKVNKSLAYDLFDFEKNRSPQKSAHHVARLMNTHSQSPYRGRVKVLGVADRDNQVLTQAAIVDRLIPMITVDKRDDRNRIRLGGSPINYGLDPSQKTVFRNLWCLEKDDQIAITLVRYFDEIRLRWPDAWNDDSSGVILYRTNGFFAFMRLLKDLLVRKQPLALAPEREYFKSELEKIKIDDDQFNSDNYKPGTSGESALYKDLKAFF